MNRGGKRVGAGRKQIDGKIYRIKIDDEIIHQLDFNFLGTNINEKIRECIDLGLEKFNMKSIECEEKFTVVDLFSGAGGLSRGFLDAGYNVVLGIDFDDMALKTFKENHGDAAAMKLDLFNHDNITQIEHFLNDRNIKIDVLVGGPPCQGFSLAGPRNVEDKRNTLYTAMVKIAERFKPKVVMLENVPGLLTLFEGKAARRIIEDFTKIGYKIDAKVLYAPDFGVPQIRKRVFFVGLLNSEEYFEFPKPIYPSSSYITCQDAIGDLPALEGLLGEETQNYEVEPLNEYQKSMRKNSTAIHNHIGTIHEEKTIKLISMVPEGKNFRALPEEYSSKFKYNEALTRYHSKKPSLTINTGHRSHFHYKHNRIPTVRESARLQTFPDDFIFYGNKSQQYKQVGNAVPPLLGYHLAAQLKKYLNSKAVPQKKYKMVDIFSGCGGLTDGFMQTGAYNEIAAVEWHAPMVETLRNRLTKKWNIMHANESVLHFDIQREDELFNGWDNDPEFGSSKGLDFFVNDVDGLDLIIGGPPCQAYSVAGRVRDENGMKNDYRNYLFEHYLSIVNRYRPSIFVFENVPGILSAVPDGTPITQLIKKGFDSIDYDIIEDLGKFAVVNASEFGVPQNRKRVIILGIDKKKYKNTQKTLELFYKEILPKYKSDKIITVKDAIGDLPPCDAIWDEQSHKIRISHVKPTSDVTWHIPRYSNLRDMDTFKTLAFDIESGRREYNSKRISELYEDKIGSKSPIHRYHVLEPDQPSTTIIAHLYKDGNRFIHYDPKQSRTITVREAARLQSFDDDFEFHGSQGRAYQMIGNAVPPQLAKNIALAIKELFEMLSN